jgi:hypothetical protein
MIELQLPVGRLLTGDLYKGVPVMDDRTKQPVLDGQGAPRIAFKASIGIAKGTEQHWSQTEWGAKLYSEGATSWPAPGNQYLTPSFSWKIHDGDQPWINDAGETVESPERKGHWIVRMSRTWAPLLCDSEGKTLVQDGAIYPGCFVQAVITAVSNKSPKTPGIYVNPEVVALIYHGERLNHARVDVSKYKFGGAMPPGASVTPLAGAQIAPVAQQVNPAFNAIQPQIPVPQVLAPNYAVLAPPVAMTISSTPPPPSGPQMTALAQGPYEAYIKIGWTDEQLRAAGLMV